MIRARRERWPIAGSFRIARGEKREAEVVVVEVSRDGVIGRGEAVPYARYGETVEGVLEAVAALPADVERAGLGALLPAGAARNAVDCALWDLEAKRSGARAWELAGTPAPEPVETAYTISLDSPDAMASAARAHADRPLLKLKLSAEGVLERIEAVRAVAPEAALVVDANESWTLAQLERLAPDLARLEVALVEQPLPAGRDDTLEGDASPVPLCADESCHTAADLERVARRYDAINVKLDKAGGLTEALALVRAASAAGLRVMVGCMVSTSLAVAPAVLLTPFAEWIDLDGPLLLARDREPGLRYDRSLLHLPSRGLWG